jgi:hypothetical protein
MGGESGIERAEREWAQSEVGEGVEEVWERAVSTSQRHGDEELMSSGIRLDDISPLYLLLAMMGRRGNRYANLQKIC